MESAKKKRSAEEAPQHGHKKQKYHDDSHRRHSDAHRSKDRDSQRRQHGTNGHPQQRNKPQVHLYPNNKPNPTISHEDALAQLPTPTVKSSPVPAYSHFTVFKDLPQLPEVKPGPLTTAPFKHKSTVSYNRSSSIGDITYERLEFLGDAYIELIASRLIYERFGHLTAGQQSQLRELLVKNETLAEYSRAYGFETRIELHMKEKMLDDAQRKGNKGMNKVLGDVFEAYLAAVILSDVEEGFAVAEKWLTTLWAPKLLDAAKGDRNANLDLVHDGEMADPRKVYDPAAKQELQKRILAGSDVKLQYEAYKDSVELKGDQLGQNRHFIAVYLTGYGYERKLLGKGEGKNKVEAGNWAATDAMLGDSQAIVEECEEKNRARKAQRDAEREREKASDKERG